MEVSRVHFGIILFYSSLLFPLSQNAQIVTAEDSLAIVADSSGILFVQSKRDKGPFHIRQYAQNYGGLYYEPRLNFASWGIFGFYDGAIIGSDPLFKLTDSTSTNAFYSYGLDDSHQFRLDFSDKVGGTNLNLLFDRSSSQGIIPHSDTKLQNFAVQAKGVANRFNYQFLYSSGVLEVEENGGVNSVLAFDTIPSISEFSTDGKLHSAKNLVKQRTILLANDLELGVIQMDSTDSIASKRNHHFLVAQVALSDAQAIFTMDAADIDSLVLPTPLFNEVETNDSIGYRSVRYAGGYRFYGGSQRSNFSILYEGENYDFTSLNRSRILLSIGRKWWGESEFSSSYTLLGRWKGAYAMDLIHNKSFYNGEFLTQVQLAYQRALPSYFVDRYASNHFNWTNSFDQTSHFDLKFMVHAKKAGLTLSLEQSSRSGWVYFDEQLKLKQTEGAVGVFYANVRHQFHTKYLHLYSSLLYQNTNDPGVVRIPSFALKNTLAYNFRLFHLKWTLGYSVSYWTKYEGYAFNPALRTTYLQSGNQVGGAPVVDLIASVRIGEADLFARWDNILFYNGRSFSETINYVGNRDAFLYAEYPTIPNMIRVGFNWRFIN